ncbi:hypothetical protein [Pseudoalteromonas sp. JB197]|uniref:hypothetical protein n=1 Tax=Pseudoalteromonas sp. JB197 TaxID=1434839 RepID=UPI00097EBC61|nr:hypothetical protein [Pseudoalteromonas sp. JB197]PCC11821.1 hypothetical protein CIK86_00095 [Pseudoalteromonas sp. JB197]SJN46449.1 Streptococcal hemagglutinin protein [Pseudoalteromonas sp. JB197]
MLKKSLIAIALASVSTVATAGSITLPTAAVKYSVEGYALASAADKKIASDVTITAGVGYVANDVVVLTLSNGTFDTDAAITVATADVSFLDYQTPTTIRLRLGTDIPDTGTIELTGVKYTATSAADEDEVKISSYVISSNPTIGTYDKGDEVAVAAFEQQYVAGEVTKLSGEVSTGKGRQEFTGTDNLKDSLSVVVTPSATTPLELAIDDTASTTEITYVLSGSDLSFAADYDLKVNGGNEDGKLSSDELKKAFALTKPASGTLSINEGYTELTIKEATTAATEGLALDVNVIGNAKGGSELTAPQSFTVTAKVKAAEGEFTVKGLDAAPAGAWSLDGSSGDVKFLPFGKQYAQGVAVTNSGTVVGEVTAEIWFKGEKFTGVVGEAAANTVTDISQAVRKLASTNAVDGDARVRITVNAPNCSVNALYYHKADGDRLTVPVINN